MKCHALSSPRETTTAETATQSGMLGKTPPWRKITRWLPLLLTRSLLLCSLALLALFLAGYRYIPTRGDSMEPTLSAGSLLLVRPAAPQDIQVGDILVFPDPFDGQSRIDHRVVGVVKQGNRTLAVTKGDNNPAPDPVLLNLDRSYPRVVLTVPHAGRWMNPAIGWPLLGVSAVLGLIAVHRRWTLRRTRITAIGLSS